MKYLLTIAFLILFTPLAAQESPDREEVQTGVTEGPAEPEEGRTDLITDLEIVTVNDIKNVMSEKFKSIEDYTAEIQWLNGSAEYRGKLQYKKDERFLIEFEEPAEQVIVSNGTMLSIYIPHLRVVAQQSLSEDTESALLTTTSESGLQRLFDEYSFSFFDTSTPVEFGEGTAYHLMLEQKRPKVGFREMDLWVSEEGLILQSNGTSPNGMTVSLTFENIRINTELPDYIFDFEVPADAQIIRNIIVPFSDTTR